MASRCISTLNNLDKISDRIYYKHSKGRFRAGIEAKLKAAREKADRSLRGSDKESSCSQSVRTSSAALSSRCFSTSASTVSRSTASEHPNKVGKEKTFKPSTTKSTTSEQRNKIQRRKTKSCPSCTLSNADTEVKSESDKTDISRTASIYGKYHGKESEYKPTAWFNLPQETSVGVIDSLACDAKNVKPLCYSVNIKKGESVPSLLRHNLEVRVGQNGVVRTEKKREMLDLGEEHAKHRKKRTAPLNWEEQLNWQNAHVISSGHHTNEDSSSKSLCETHPVIFHKKKSEKEKADSKPNRDKIHPPAYKFGLESRWVYPDRRNLVSISDKCITVVEVEDARSEDGEGVGMSSKCCPQHKNSKGNTSSENNEEKVPKKVSFEDEERTSIKTVDIAEEKSENLNISKTDEYKNVGLDNVRKIRPKTSQGRIRTNKDEMTVDKRKLRRPHTAPPAPPTTPSLQAEFRFSNLVPIKIPTSERDLPESGNDVQTEIETGDEKETLDKRSVSVSPEEGERNLIENEESPAFSVEISTGSTPDEEAIQDGTPRKRVTFKDAPKSAPVSRTVTLLKEGTISTRAKSSTALQRKPYKSPSPVVIVSESSLELPKNLPPAQALVALRKKIREDLAQQNHDLQLDIQQLYLRKHSD